MTTVAESPIKEEVKPEVKQEILWTPFEKQKRFLRCPELEVHYGGAAGGGKSDSLLIAALMHCQKKGSRALLLRRKFVDLERSLIQRSHVLFKGRGKYDGQNKRWKMHHNLGMIEFGHCQTAKDMENYYSAEYSFIGIDQVEQFPEEMYIFFFSRTRSTNPNIKCQIRTTSNPVGIGRAWLAKRFWIIGPNARPVGKRYPITEEIVKPNGEKMVLTYYRAFIPSRVFDNPHIMENDPMYLARLNQLSPEKRKALMDGRWDAFEGAFFQEWDPKVHVCEPFVIPKTWKRSITFDWGYSDPCAVHWIAEAPDGKMYVYREAYMQRTLDTEVARVIARHSYDEDINCIFYPWDLDFKNPQTGRSIKERMDDVWESMGLRYFLKVGNKSRLEGWAAVRYLLSLREDKEPHMKIFSTCRNLIETFPEQIHDEINPEDLDTDGNDHALDSLRYFAATYKNFYEKPAVGLPVDKSRIPVDVGGAIKVGNEYRYKKTPLSFNWMVD